MNGEDFYTAMLNIVDYMALSGNARLDLCEILDKLLDVYTEVNLDDGEDFKKSRKEWFEGITDANDAGGVKSWRGMVKRFKQLFKNGDRINIETGEEVHDTDGIELLYAANHILEGYWKIRCPEHEDKIKMVIKLLDIYQQDVIMLV